MIKLLRPLLATVSAVLAVGMLSNGGAAARPGGAAAGSGAAALARSLPAWGSEPVPQFGSGRTELHAISVLSASEAWSVGAIGLSQDQGASPLVERWDGTAWSVVQL